MFITSYSNYDPVTTALLSSGSYVTLRWIGGRWGEAGLYMALMKVKIGG